MHGPTTPVQIGLCSSTSKVAFTDGDEATQTYVGHSSFNDIYIARDGLMILNFTSNY
jgi:hypothetical protein